MKGFFMNRGKTFNEYVEEARNTEDAIILDVRTQEEYDEFHLEDVMHIPLNQITKAEQMIQNKETPIFVHCLSGGRSEMAKDILEQLGFTHVINIGGIADYMR